MDETNVNIETTEQVDTSTQSEDTITTEPFKTFTTEDDYKKELQSVSSKAKYEILKELGIKNVGEFNTMKEKYQTAINEQNDLKKRYDELSNEKTKLNEQNAILRFNISPDYAEDALTLAKTKVSETTTLDDALQTILSKNPSWQNGNSNITFGTEKSNVDSTTEEQRKIDAVLNSVGIFR